MTRRDHVGSLEAEVEQDQVEKHALRSPVSLFDNLDLEVVLFTVARRKNRSNLLKVSPL